MIGDIGPIVIALAVGFAAGVMFSRRMWPPDFIPPTFIIVPRDKPKP